MANSENQSTPDTRISATPSRARRRVASLGGSASEAPDWLVSSSVNADFQKRLVGPECPSSQSYTRRQLQGMVSSTVEPAEPMVKLVVWTVDAIDFHDVPLPSIHRMLLWDEAPLPVRGIRKRLAEQGRDLAHTSVITTTNTMFDKGFVLRKKQANAFLFSPKVAREEVSQRMLGDVVSRVFDGSAAAVMLSLFECSDLDADEVKAMRRLFNRKVKEQQE